MTKRTTSHQIDTSAVRLIGSQLSHDWIIRGQEERDYGMDLTIERFDNQDATGDYFLVQVKGTKSPFEDKVKMTGFPTKTIKYSMLFNVPFFVFYTSIETRETRFIHLQKYAEHKLVRTTPNWEKQDTITIYFPDENDLDDNLPKIIDILEKDKLKKVGVHFIHLFESLKMMSESVLLGQYGVGQECHAVCISIIKINKFINRYSQNMIYHGDELKIFDLSDIFKDIAISQKITREDAFFIKEQISFLDQVKVSFLMDDDYDDLAVKMQVYEPY